MAVKLPKGTPSTLEAGFMTIFRATRQAGVHDLPDPTEQFPFDPDQADRKPQNRFRFDFCYEKLFIAIETDGITGGKGGGHQRRKGFIKDRRRDNRAAMLGYMVLRYTGADLIERPVQVMEEIAELYKRRRKAITGQS